MAPPAVGGYGSADYPLFEFDWVGHRLKAVARFRFARCPTQMPMIRCLLIFLACLVLGGFGAGCSHHHHRPHIYVPEQPEAVAENPAPDPLIRYRKCKLKTFRGTANVWCDGVDLGPTPLTLKVPINAWGQYVGEPKTYVAMAGDQLLGQVEFQPSRGQRIPRRIVFTPYSDPTPRSLAGAAKP